MIQKQLINGGINSNILDEGRKRPADIEATPYPK
jgi:hypothetical protein